MEVYETVWLYADNQNPNGNTKATFTVDGLAPGNDILATISLSNFSEGVSYDQHTVGGAGSLVRHWQTFNADGSLSDFDNTDFAGNSVFINNCASVTFELSATFARSYAQATVFVL